MKCIKCGNEFSETVYPLHLGRCNPTDIEKLNSFITTKETVENEAIIQQANSETVASEENVQQANLETVTSEEKNNLFEGFENRTELTTEIKEENVQQANPETVASSTEAKKRKNR